MTVPLLSTWSRRLSQPASLRSYWSQEAGKEAIENHFDAHYELEHRLEKKGKETISRYGQKHHTRSCHGDLC